MKSIILAAGLTLGLLAPAAATAQAQAQGNFSPVISTQSGSGGMAPPAGFAGQWYTLANGCTYSRAQAPGYPPRWVIVKNPRHLGLPNAHRRCAPML